jgi:hypothetical protein
MDCKILTVISLYILEVLHYIKQHNGNLTQNLNIYDGNMRKKCDYHVQICNTSLFRKSVLSVGTVLYNKVPNRIKKLESFKVFKVELKSPTGSFFLYGE